jgi:hypothetical protein
MNRRPHQLPPAGPMNLQLISSEGNGGNCNPSAESWRLAILGHYPCSSLSISTSIAILRWTNVNTTHLAVHTATARRKMQQSSASKERDTCDLSRAGEPHAGRWRTHAIMVFGCVPLFSGQPLPHPTSLDCLCSGGGQAYNCQKRAAAHYSCLCRCAICHVRVYISLGFISSSRPQVSTSVLAPQLTNTSPCIQIQTQLLDIYKPYFLFSEFQMQRYPQ